MMTVARNHFSGSYNASKMEPEELISYRESLTDLKANSKPHINMLTMLAEESFQQGSAVVRAIEDHILQVNSKHKLPSLYLIDSIMKNVTQGDFEPLFRPRLVAIVSHIFSQSDEMQRVSIFKLRHTWTGLFEDSYLAQLDRAIHAIDEKWPIVAPADSTPSTRPVIRASRAANLQVGGGRLETSLRVPSPVPPPMEVDLSPQDWPVLESIKNIPSPSSPQKPTKRKTKAFTAIKTEVPAKVSGVSVRVESLKPPRPIQNVVASLAVVKMDEEPSSAKFKLSAPVEKPQAEKLDPPPEFKAEDEPSEPPKRPLARIPKKPGSGSITPRGRGRVLGSLVSDKMKASDLKAPKRALDQQGPQAAESTHLKFQKVNFRPLNEDMEPPSRPAPTQQQRFNNAERHSRPPLQKPAVQNKMRGMDVPRHHYPRQNFHRPYDAPPRREMERPWLGPDRGPPPTDRYGPRSPLNNTYMGNNRPRSPLMPNPLIERRPTPYDLFDIGMREVREKLERGEINSVTHQQMVEKLKKDLDMNELRAVVEQSAQRIPLDAGMDSPNVVFIDEQARVVRWVNDVGPVVVIDGLVFDIGFNSNSPPVNVYIDHIATSLRMDKESSLFFGSKFHTIKFGGPNFELIIDGKPYRINFEAPEMVLHVDGQPHRVRLGGPPPQVSIGSQPLNYRIFGNPSAPVAEQRQSLEPTPDELINRILSSKVFAQLVTPSIAAPVVETPELLPPVIASTLPPLPVRAPTGENGLDWSKSTESRRVQSPEVFSNARAMLKALIQAPESANSDWKLHDETTDIRDISKARISGELYNLHLPFLEKLCLDGEMPCRLCEERFVRGEMTARSQNILYHNGWTAKKEAVNTADWHIDSEEFIDEKSFECDTTSFSLNKVFIDFVVKNRPAKAAEMAVEEESLMASSTPSESTETADFIIEHKPVALRAQKNDCEICLEDIVVELNEDDDEWTLRDGVKVTSKVDGSVHIYHKDCYEQNKKTPVQTEENGPTLMKPSRWGTSVIETPTRVTKSDQSAWSFSADSVPTSLITAQVDTKTDAVNTEVSPPVQTVPEEDSAFVIAMGDDDQYEDEDIIINTQDDEEV